MIFSGEVGIFAIMRGQPPKLCRIHAAAGTMVGPSNNTFEVLSVVQAASWLERESADSDRGNHGGFRPDGRGLQQMAAHLARQRLEAGEGELA